MTDEQLAAIRARCEVATPGPWIIGHVLIEPTLHRSVHDADGWMLANCDLRNRPAEQTESNVAFIAHAREDVPALLAEVERLRGLLSSGAAALIDGINRRANEEAPAAMTEAPAPFLPLIHISEPTRPY